MTRGAATFLAAVGLIAAVADAKPPDRYGAMGRILDYDPEKLVVRVKVVETRIPDWANHVGKRPPKEIRPGREYVFSVRPEGSVLNRTIIRTQKGTTLDRTASREGFNRAIAALPDDRLLGISIAPTPGADGEPSYKVMMIQIPRTLEEAMRRFEEVSVEE